MSRDINMSKWLATGKFDKKDEYYTPSILVNAIVPFIDPQWTVWCPFDTAESEFVHSLTEHGCKVIHSHIWEGKDFFDYNPTEPYDAIVSNPPFTRKLDVLKRLYAIGKPFAMVMGLPILNYQEIGEFFCEGHPLQLLIVDKKVSFDGKTASFNNSFFCSGILPRDIIFAHLPHNNSGRNFTASRMRGERELQYPTDIKKVKNEPSMFEECPPYVGSDDMDNAVYALDAIERAISEC